VPLTPSTGWVATPVRGVAINWNGGSPCIGILGRHDPVRSLLGGFFVAALFFAVDAGLKLLTS
jgi:hypothetical protein